MNFLTSRNEEMQINVSNLEILKVECEKLITNCFNLKIKKIFNFKTTMFLLFLISINTVIFKSILLIDDSSIIVLFSLFMILYIIGNFVIELCNRVVIKENLMSCLNILKNIEIENKNNNLISLETKSAYLFCKKTICKTKKEFY